MSRLKELIGQRIREWRGDVSQEAIEAMSGVHRTIIGAIERGARDYRIDGLLSVIVALRADEKVVFDGDPLTAKLQEELAFVLERGSSDDIQFVMMAIRRAHKSAKQAPPPPIPFKRPT